MALRGILLDLEGVLYQDGRPIDGAIGAVAAMRESGIGIRFLTNTTTRPRRDIRAAMHAMGFDAVLDDIFSPAIAARSFLASAGVTRIHLAAPQGLAEDFEGFTLVEDDPEAVVIGDLHNDFSWRRVNRLYGMLRGGARFVALHKNRYCRREDGLALDLGPFVVALEYAAAVEAEIMGKPSPAFFAIALASLGLNAGDVIMVGDDIEADIGGAQDAGLSAVQVETGKYSVLDLRHPRIAPLGRIPSVAGLPAFMEGMT